MNTMNLKKVVIKLKKSQLWDTRRGASTEIFHMIVSRTPNAHLDPLANKKDSEIKVDKRL